ncbi:unnamed protein product, partial [Mesorhabditis spiculigera]
MFVILESRAEGLVQGSTQNREEARLAMQLIKKLLRHFPAEQFWAITYYNSQKKLIETIKTTRARSGDFLACPLRACVATTRARQGLIVIGSASAFQSPNWWDLFNVASLNRWTVPAHEITSGNQ